MHTLWPASVRTISPADAARGGEPSTQRRTRNPRRHPDMLEPKSPAMASCCMPINPNHSPNHPPRYSPNQNRHGQRRPSPTRQGRNFRYTGEVSRASASAQSPTNPARSPDRGEIGMVRVSAPALRCILACIIVLCFLASPIHSNAQAGSPAPAADANDDLIKMISAGLPESVVIAKIKDNAGRWDTSVDALIVLKRAGATEAEFAVLTAGPQDAFNPSQPMASSFMGGAIRKTLSGDPMLSFPARSAHSLSRHPAHQHCLSRQLQGLARHPRSRHPLHSQLLLCRCQRPLPPRQAGL